MSRNMWGLGSVIAIIVIVLIWWSRGCPPVAEAGTDCWTTENPGTWQTLPPLVADFFGTGSLPISNEQVQLIGEPLLGSEALACGCPEKVETEVVWKDQHGTTVGAESKHKVSNSVVQKTAVDTCVGRKAEIKFDEFGVAFNVEIELLELSLKSVEPFRVFYADESFKDFDILVTDTPPQIPGSMSFTADDKTGGTIQLAALHVNYQVEFTEVGGPAVFATTAELIFDKPTPGTFAM